MAWSPPTLADTGVTGPVRCGCRRTVDAGMMFDMAQLDAGVAVPRGDRFVCDACRERMIRSGAITKAAYLAAMGAPAELVARHTIAQPPGVP